MLATYGSAVANRLASVYSNVERKRRLLIPIAVRDFVESVAVESLFYRSDEWRQKHTLDVLDPIQLGQAVDEIAKIVSSILQNSDSRMVNGTVIIGVIDVVAEMRRRWCGIFPFCR